MATFGGAGAALILGAAIFISSRPGDTPKETLSPVPPVPTEAPKPEKTSTAPLPPPVSVTPSKEITLKVEPIDAHVFYGDKDLGDNLVKIPIEEGDTIEVEIRRDGYATKKITLDGSKEQQSIRLSREKSGPRPSGSPKNPPPAGSGKKPKNRGRGGEAWT